MKARKVSERSLQDYRGERFMKSPPRIHRRKVRAFTLIEVVIALAILSIALLAIFKGNLFSLRSWKEASELTTAVIAAESIMKDVLGKGFPESGVVEGEFEEGLYEGMEWIKKVETLSLPFTDDLKLVSIEVHWGEGKSYTLETVISRY